MHDAEKRLIVEELFKQHFHRLYVHAYGWVHDEECAKDIVHDAFCHLWENLDRYPDTKKFLTLLYIFVRSRSVDYLRHGQAEENYLRSYTNDAEVDDTEEYRQYEQRIAKVMKAVNHLPPQTRRIVVGCVFHHKSYKEVAAELGISPLTVKTYMARALKALRTQKEFFSPILVLLFALHYVL